MFTARVRKQTRFTWSHVTSRGHGEARASQNAGSFLVCAPELCNHGGGSIRGSAMALAERQETAAVIEPFELADTRFFYMSAFVSKTRLDTRYIMATHDLLTFGRTLFPLPCLAHLFLYRDLLFPCFLFELVFTLRGGKFTYILMDDCFCLEISVRSLLTNFEMLARTTMSRAFSNAALAHTFTGAVGNTPLIYLKRLSEKTGYHIYGKSELQNPGGSVKDRAALGLVQDAEAKGMIKPGGTIVEGTAGNTGIGLAHVCRARGYNCVIFMPNTQSQEKMDLLRMLGADVRPVPAVAYENPDNYNHQAKRFAESTENAFWTNQFDNTANAHAHYVTTGPELWQQTAGDLDGFICATGTGGTLAGVGKYLKEKSNGRVQVWLADPPGSVLASYYENGGKLVERTGSSITEGIGQGRITDNLATFVNQLDGAFTVPDEKSIVMVYELLDTEGLYLGASSALNVVAAVELAEKLGKGSKVATILCDGAYRYQSRLFSKKWLASKDLDKVIPPHLKKYAVLD